jgi:hypothetical protein
MYEHTWCYIILIYFDIRYQKHINDISLILKVRIFFPHSEGPQGTRQGERHVRGTWMGMLGLPKHPRASPGSPGSKFQDGSHQRSKRVLNRS